MPESIEEVQEVFEDLIEEKVAGKEKTCCVKSSNCHNQNWKFTFLNWNSTVQDWPDRRFSGLLAWQEAEQSA